MDQPTRKFDAAVWARRMAMPVGLTGLIIVFAWLCTRGSLGRWGIAESVWVLATGGGWALSWLAAAIGVGWPLRRWLLPSTDCRLESQAALGIAAMLLLDTTLGRLGLLQIGGSSGAWGLIAIGLILLLLQAIDARLKDRRIRLDTLPPIFWAAAPAIAVLLVASCSAPGWLWASEFGGYDVLSYHLQLPKEWMTLGRIEGLEHNVYSFLPSYMESAYYHLAVLIGDATEAAYACQLLHASLAIVAATITVRIGRIIGGAIAGGIAGAVILGTPWVIVAGSMAYDEMAMLVMLAGGMLILFEPTTNNSVIRRAAAIGLLAGIAIGAKLTAAGFVAIPLGLLLLLEQRPFRRRITAGLVVTGFAAVVLFPYLFGNWVATSNPVFPFATGLFGTGHWSVEQAMIWSEAHIAGHSVTGRLVEAWHQLMRYGVGPSPYQGEPWIPQWSVLLWLTIITASVCLAQSKMRPVAFKLGLILLLQAVFWVVFTHVKSRFMLPAVIPAALLCAMGCSSVLGTIREPMTRGISIKVLSLLMVIFCFLPSWVFIKERDGSPAELVGAIDNYTGQAFAEQFARTPLTADQRREVLTDAPIAAWINHLLPGRRIRVLFIGDATPFYYQPDRVDYQTTWDRGPLSIAMDLYPDSPAQWISHLREEGFTHLLVDQEMLRIWADEGWNDPRITAESVIAAADSNCTLIAPSDPRRSKRLYLLDERK